MAFKNHIPNSITLLNLTSGITSVYFGVKGTPADLALAGLFIFIGAVFDFFDGFSARLLHAKSDIGLQLDSLSDMVTFGVAPGFILYQMIRISYGNPVVNGFDFLPLVAIMVPWMSALRLAKFNIDETQVTSFKGLPTPALAIFVASLPIIRQQLYASQNFWYLSVTNTYFLFGVAVLGSLLLVSSFPMFSLKFKSYGWQGNNIKYIFLAVAIVLVAVWQIVAVPLIILFYLLLSWIAYLRKSKG